MNNINVIFDSGITHKKATNGDTLEFCGTLHCYGCPFNFNIRKINYTSSYKLRGKITMRSPKTGKTLYEKYPKRKRNHKKKMSDISSQQNMQPEDNKSAGSDRTSKKPISAELWERSAKPDTEELKDRIARTALSLYQEYKYVLDEEMGYISTQHMSIAIAIHTYADVFLNTTKPGIKSSTLRKHKNNLNKLATDLQKYKMDHIPVSALRALFKKYDKQAMEIFRLASSFWTYCSELGVYRGNNPFTEYLRDHAPKGKRVSEETALKQLKPESLPERVERNILQAIQLAKSTDLGITAILLILCFGVTPKEALEQKWGEILFNRLEAPIPHAQFVLIKKFMAGATHDFTRPGVPFLVRELYRRYTELKSINPDIDEEYILADQDGKRMQYRYLVKYCKDFLITCGASYAHLKTASGKKYGAGVTLLLQHYKYRIVIICGIPKEDGITTFLTGRSLSKDVTSDNYRSFTSKEGQQNLLKVLSRDKRFEEVNIEPLQIETVNNITTITAVARNPMTFTHVEATLRLKKGDVIEIMSPSLFYGNGSAKKTESDALHERT